MTRSLDCSDTYPLRCYLCIKFPIKQSCFNAHDRRVMNGRFVIENSILFFMGWAKIPRTFLYTYNLSDVICILPILNLAAFLNHFFKQPS